MADKKEKVAVGHTKSELMTATVFKGRRDILNAVIKDGETLTVEDAQKRIDEFMKGKVD